MPLCPLPHQRDEPAAAQLGVCAAHYRRIRNLIEAVARDYALVATMLEPGSTGTETDLRPPRHVDPQAPARLDALVLRDPRTQPNGHQQPIPRIVADYSSRTTEALKLQRRHTFTEQIHVLLTHTAWITKQPWADSLHTDLDHCARALAHDLGDTPRTNTYATCPLIIRGTTCGGRIRALTYSLGVHCDRCQAQWIGDAELTRLRSTLTDNRPDSSTATRIGEQNE